MGHYFIDTCSFWVSNIINYIMSLKQIDFTKVVNDDAIPTKSRIRYSEERKRGWKMGWIWKVRRI